MTPAPDLYGARPFDTLARHLASAARYAPPSEARALLTHARQLQARQHFSHPQKEAMQ